MPKGICLNTGRTWFKKGHIPWCKGKKGTYSLKHNGQFKNGHPGFFKNKHLSEETKEKLRKINTGKQLSQKTKNKIRLKLLGVPKTQATRKKLSIAKKGIPLHPNVYKNILRGKNHPRWRGGVSTERDRIKNTPQYRNWRLSVFRRDDFTCKMCGLKTKKGNKVYLNAHHIQPFSKFPELRFSIENGMTVCENCHKKTDNYGYKVNEEVRRVQD